MKRLLFVLPLLALAGLTAVFLLSSLRRDPDVKPDAMVGRPLPAVALSPLGGGAAAPLASATGKPGYVNFFASWCTPCLVEHPELMKLKARGVPVLGVAYKDAPEKSRAFLDRQGDPFSTVLTDPDGRAFIEFGMSGVPETFLVGADGTILDKHAGPLTPEVITDLERQREQAAALAR